LDNNWRSFFLLNTWEFSAWLWGVILARFMHLLIQLVAVVSLGYHYQWQFNLNDKNLRKILKMMVPRTLTLICFSDKFFSHYYYWFNFNGWQYYYF
jgi:peptidoglycan biosynthesis protein MviN/MurJ (putative lipid II flippase)